MIAKTCKVDLNWANKIKDYHSRENDGYNLIIYTSGLFSRGLSRYLDQNECELSISDYVGILSKDGKPINILAYEDEFEKLQYLKVTMGYSVEQLMAIFLRIGIEY